MHASAVQCPSYPSVRLWQIGNCACLEKIQRKGLAVCLGVPGTTGVEALEVEAGIKPLEIRSEELAARQNRREGNDQEPIQLSHTSHQRHQRERNTNTK